MNSELISIIIPVYNAEKYLNKCIDSILAQTYSNFELILINDGSSDSSLQICNNYKLKDKRVNVIHKDNTGVSNSRNLGIDVSNGKYIMFVDSDDYVESNWCEVLHDKMIKNMGDFIISGYTIVNKRENKDVITMKIMDIHNDISKIKKEDIFKVYEKNLLNSPFNKIYLLEVIKSNNIRFKKDLTLGEDLLFNLEYIKYIKNDILIVNKSLYNYILRRAESLNNKYYANLFDIYRLLQNELESYFKIFNVDMSIINERFYTKQILLYMKVLKNTFHEKNNLNFFKKIQFNNMVLKSIEFKRALENVKKDKYNRIFLLAIKSENYLFLHILINISNRKNKIYNTIKIFLNNKIFKIISE